MAGRTHRSPPDLTTQNGRLRWAREVRGYPSARQAARAIHGINESTYKSHETGARRANSLSYDDAKQYSGFFRIRLDWLLSGMGSPTDDAVADVADRSD